MNGAAVFLITFFTSVATSVGTVYLVERLQLFEEKIPTVTVPNLKGLEESIALSHIREAGLVGLIDGRKDSSSQEDGTVIEQSLPAGQKVPQGQHLGITLAKATPLVPSVVGLSLELAKKRLKEAGYEIEEAEVDHDSIEKGHVVGQDPEDGVTLEKGKSVKISVSQGPALVEVPRLSGFHYSKAKKTLDDLGLETKVRWVELAETWSSVVLSQTPEPGEKVRLGSDVEIVMNRD